MVESKLPGIRKAVSQPENESIHFLVWLLLFPVRQAHRRAGFTGLPGSGSCRSKLVCTGNTPFLVLFRAPKENAPSVLSALLSPLAI